MKYGRDPPLNSLGKEKLMNNEKLVSVNITTYNRATILPRCLESILAQDYKNMEIIVVDDCSNDNTSEIIKKFQERDDRIKYFKHHTNKGNAYARNSAFQRCKGYYVAFMDDDDEWIEKNKIKKQVEIFENSKDKKLGLVCSGIIRHRINGEKIIEKAFNPRDIKYEALKGGLIHNSTVLTKSETMKEVGGFDLNVCRGIDSEFFRRMIVIFNYNVFFMEDITTQYYETSNNRLTMSENCKGFLKHIISQFVNLRKYFKHFLKRPSLLIVRIYIIIMLIFRYIKCFIQHGK